MIERNEQLKATVTYMNRAWEPVDAKNAYLVKVTYDNGDVVFGTLAPPRGSLAYEAAAKLLEHTEASDAHTLRLRRAAHKAWHGGDGVDETDEGEKP